MRIWRGVAVLLFAWCALAAVPTPQSHFGHEIGADRTVLDWDKVVTYFQALARASDRIRVEDLEKARKAGRSLPPSSRNPIPFGTWIAIARSNRNWPTRVRPLRAKLKSYLRRERRW